jgi:hypothetical protein
MRKNRKIEETNFVKRGVKIVRRDRRGITSYDVQLRFEMMCRTYGALICSRTGLTSRRVSDAGFLSLLHFHHLDTVLDSPFSRLLALGSQIRFALHKKQKPHHG